MDFCFLMLLFFVSNTLCSNNISPQNEGNNKILSEDELNLKKKVVFITGSTGVMGTETLNNFFQHLSEFRLKLLVRPSKKNKKTMERIIKKYNNQENNIEVIWGDLLNYEDVLKGVEGSDYVLHIGGSVSPKCDLQPYLTYRTNVHGAQHIAKAILQQKNKDDIKVCFIGSVAETGNRNYPIHWGRTGDPIKISIYDHYAISKVIAERVFVESGIKNWVIFRQSAILNPNIFHNIDPIIFHVPLNDVLEWCTVEDAGRLMLNLVLKDKNKELPSDFWNRFYNVGSGESYRYTNYEFYSIMFKYVGIGKIESSFEPRWFTTKNFHGHYFLDSDILEDYLHFRGNVPTDEYYERTMTKIDFFFKIPNYIPFKSFLAFFVKPVMKLIASTKNFGTLNWIKTNNSDRISSFYGSFEDYEKIPASWSDFKIEKFNTSVVDGMKYSLNHGYDEKKPMNELDIDDMKEAAIFRGGEIVSKKMIKGDLRSKLVWRCGHCGKTFEASPTLILLGGHWCPHCFVPLESWDYDSIAKQNPFFAQVWYPDHNKNENNVYQFKELFNDSCFEKPGKQDSEL